MLHCHTSTTDSWGSSSSIWGKSACFRDQVRKGVKHQRKTFEEEASKDVFLLIYKIFLLIVNILLLFSINSSLCMHIEARDSICKTYLLGKCGLNSANIKYLQWCRTWYSSMAAVGRQVGTIWQELGFQVISLNSIPENHGHVCQQCLPSLVSGIFLSHTSPGFSKAM
jgi:hypothetical protein